MSYKHSAYIHEWYSLFSVYNLQYSLLNSTQNSMTETHVKLSNCVLFVYVGDVREMVVIRLKTMQLLII